MTTQNAQHPYSQVLQWVAEGKEIEDHCDGFWSKCSYDAVLSAALHGKYLGCVLRPQDFRLKPERHVHQDLIDAWKNGAKIQWWSNSQKEWFDQSEPVFYPDNKYRVKPEPKPDVVRYIHVTKGISVAVAHHFPSDWLGTVLEVTLDGETGEIKHSKKYQGDFND